MRRTLLQVALFAVTFGCESSHPARETAQGFVDAVVYGDEAQIFAGHVESTSQSEWCRAEFETVLQKAQGEATAEDCQRVRSLTGTDLEAMRDELRLAVQITGWSCEHPKGSCTDYAQTVFEQALQAHPLVGAKHVRSATIRRTFGDESTAAAYVDFLLSDGTMEHRTLQLRKVGEGWRVAGGFLQK